MVVVARVDLNAISPLVLKRLRVNLRRGRLGERLGVQTPRGLRLPCELILMVLCVGCCDP